jgi:hypothetical protein
MSRENLTRAVLTQDGRVLIEQHDGSYRPAASRTDWDRIRAMSDEEVEAAAAGDPDAPAFDEAFWQKARLVFPRPVRSARWPRLPDAHQRRATRLRRGPKARRPITGPLMSSAWPHATGGRRRVDRRRGSGRRVPRRPSHPEKVEPLTMLAVGMDADFSDRLSA